MSQGEFVAAYELLESEAARIAAVDEAQASLMLADAAMGASQCRGDRAAVGLGREAHALGTRAGGTAQLVSDMIFGASLVMSGETEQGTSLVLRHAQLPEGQDRTSRGLADHANRARRPRGVRPGPCFLDWLTASARALSAPSLLVPALQLRSDLGYRTGDWLAAYADAVEGLRLARETNGNVPVRTRLSGPDRSHARARARLQRAHRRAHSAGKPVQYRRGPYVRSRVPRQARARPWTDRRSDRRARRGHPSHRASPDARAKLGSGGPRPDRSLCASGQNRRGEAKCSQISRRRRKGPSVCGSLPPPPAAAGSSPTSGRSSGSSRRRSPGTTAHRRPSSAHEPSCASASASVVRGDRATLDCIFAPPWRCSIASTQPPGAHERVRSLKRAERSCARRDDGGLRSLTPQELQLALIVGRGATNKEASAALFVSPKTVEAHLHHIYVKLSIRSRTELARVLALAQMLD